MWVAGFKHPVLLLVSGTPTLRAERQSAGMSKITQKNDLTRSNTGCFMLHQYDNSGCQRVNLNMFLFCLTWLTCSSNTNTNMFVVDCKQFSEITNIAEHKHEFKLLFWNNVFINRLLIVTAPQVAQQGSAVPNNRILCTEYRPENSSSQRMLYTLRWYLVDVNFI